MASLSSESSIALGIHRGAIDQSTVTTLSPPNVMGRVRAALKSMGAISEAESDYKLFCTRPGKSGQSSGAKPSSSDDEGEEEKDDMPTPKASADLLPDVSGTTAEIVYGDQEPGDEVRFSVELTRLEGLSETYSLDIRRMKGNLRSYKFVYDTLREKVNLQEM